MPKDVYNSHYEKLPNGEVRCIDNEIPFEIPESWAWVRVKHIVNVGSARRVHERDWRSTGIPFYRAREIGKLAEFGKVDNDLFIEQALYNEFSKSGVPLAGDLMVTAVGTLGKVYVVHENEVFYYKDGSVLCLENVNHLNPYFLKLAIESPCFINQYKGESQGTTVATLTMVRINEYLLPVPPLNEQNRIVAKIESLQPIIDKYSKAQQELDNLNSEVYNLLKKSILQEAIQGRLVPQDSNEEPATKLLERIRVDKQKLVKEGKLKAKDISDSIIFKGDDNKYYEKCGNTLTCIDGEIIFDVPKGWELARLSNIAQIYTGNSISESEKKARYTGVSGREYVGTKDVGFDCSVQYNNGVAIPKQYESAFKIAPAYSVLMCIEGGSAGRKTAIIDRDICFGNKLCCFAPFVNISIYIFYYLQSPLFFEMFNSGKTGIIGGVSVNNVKNLLIPIPPYQEMQRIIDKLEQALASIMSR